MVVVLRRTLSSCGRRVVAILIAYCRLVGTDHLSTTSSSSDLRSSEVKDARIACRVNDSRSSTPKLRAAANSYSRSMVVHSRTGSSVLRDTSTPASTRIRIGCSPNDGTAPRTTFEVRQHSTVTPESRTRCSSSSVAAACTPWPIRLIPGSLRAAAMLAVENSPAWAVMPSPSFGRLYLHTRRPPPNLPRNRTVRV